MKKLFLLFLLLALPVQPSPQPSQPPQSLQKSRPFVFTHITVIDATGAPARPDMTVVIRGDQIAELGKSGTVRAPEGAQVVDGTGKFMIPGLWDMHVHWFHQSHLPLFIANGVTGIRMMWGMPMHQQWRKEIEQGTLTGPRMAIASAIVDGPKPIWPGSLAVGTDAEARQAVDRSKQEGADFIKVYSRLPREAYLGIADEAKKLGIPFAGHVPASVSVAEASDAGQKSIEHLTNFLEACSTREEDLRKMGAEAWQNLPEGQAFPSRASIRPLTRLSLETFSPDKANALFARLARNHTWQCPTLTVLRNVASLDDPKLHSDPRLKYMPADIANGWNPKDDFRFKDRTAEDYELGRATYKKLTELIAPMRKAGVEFLAGTDVINPYCFPGFSLHDELELLVQAGLSPMEALQAATLNPARFLGKEKNLGTVEKGKIADLLVLEANPLESIGNTRKIDAVVFGGRVIPKEGLQKMLAELARP